MPALRCPHCDTALTEAEALTGTCPDCAIPIAGDPAPEAIPVLPTASPVRGRWLTFPAGLVAGVVVALAGAVAWSAWGPPLRPANAADEPRAEAGTASAIEERVGRVEVAARAALEAAAVAEEHRTAAEEELADLEALAEAAEERVAGLQRAAAEAEARAKAAGSLAARTRDAEDRAQKAQAAVQQAQAQRAVAERALADARTKLQAVQVQQADLGRQVAAAQGQLQIAKAKEDQARQAEAEAHRARQTADRQLADVRNRLQAARTEADSLDKALGERKTKLAERDRAIEAKKAELATLERAVAARRAKSLPTPEMEAVGPKPAGAFVREWLVVGPFADPDRKGHATAYPPEAEPVDPAKDYKGVGSLLRWRAHTSPTDYVDFATLFKVQDPAVAYAVCWVRADRARTAQLSLGSNDGIKVWVNGKEVADRPVSRSAAPGQDRAACELVAGWNELRVKVDNTGGPWGFYFEVQEPGGKGPLAGLEFRVTPPTPKPRK